MNTEIQPPKKIADLATFLPAPEIKRLLTQKEMAALKAADDAWKSLNERLAKVSHDATRARVKIAKDKLVSTGEFDLERFELLKAAELEKSHAVRRGLKQHAQKLSSEVIGPAVLPGIRKVVGVLQTRLEEITGSEQQIAASLGITHIPSENVRSLAALLDIVRKQSAGAESGSWSGGVPRFFFGDL